MNTFKLILAFIFAVVGCAPAYSQVNPVQEQALPEKQYIANGGYENSKAGWVSYKDTAQALPVDGTGGAATLSVAASTSSPLAGKSSGVLTKTAANLQGEGISYAFQVEPADKGKVLSISGIYQIASGTYSGGTSTTDSDVVVSIYDMDAGQVIQPAGYKLDGSVTGVSYNINATFQTNISSTNYRLILHVATTTTQAFSLKLDRIKVSAQSKSQGPPVTDWQAYTPTITNSNATTSGVAGQWRRVGGNLDIRVTIAFSSAGSGAGAVAVSLPSGLTTSSTNGDVVGSGFTFATTFASLSVRSQGTTVYFSRQGAANNLLGSEVVNAMGLVFEASMPIAGWASTVTMSDSADSRVVAAHLSGTTTTIANSTTATAIQFTTIVSDTHGRAGTGTPNSYSIPVSGYYRITGGYTINGTNHTTAGWVVLFVFKDGVVYGPPLNHIGSPPDWYSANGSATLYFNAGETVSLRANISNGNAATVLSNGFLQLERISGPSQVAATDSVSVIATNAGGQSIANNTETTVTGWTKVKDSHSSFSSSGVFTAPTPGTYLACLGLIYANAATGANQYVARIAQAGSVTRSVAVSSTFPTASGTNFVTIPSGCTQFSMITGDTLTTRTLQLSGAARSTHTDPDFNIFTVSRVGNL